MGTPSPATATSKTMTHLMSKSCTVAALLLLTSIHLSAHVAANDEYLCSVGPDGEQVCEEVYFEPEFHDAIPEDFDEDEDAADERWRASLAVEECTDHDADCSTWAEGGECDSNPGYMKYECAESCGACEDFDAAYEALRDGKGDGPCTDKYRECKNWGAMGECSFNPDFMLVECERSCLVCYEDTNQFGVHQDLPSQGDENYSKTAEVIQASIQYMRKIWTPTKENNRINYKCRNLHSECSYWAVDECDIEDPNSEWMQTNCAPACQTCHLLDSTLRCPIEEGNECVIEPGGLNTLMETILNDQKYNPKALSRPKIKSDGTAAPDVAEDGPWVLVLEHFITDVEADALVAAGHKKGYERSSDVGVENPDGTHEEDVSEGRTSTNSWCDAELCEQDPVIGPVVERIAAVTGTSVNNSEHLQLLRYEPGQHYERHHDYIEYQQGMPCGVRMLTLFLYLNDVEEGGGTHFPDLDITVQPKKGSALLWPSVLDEDPEEKDKRTDHEALPVIQGIKYGANAWIHTRDYRKAEEIDCS